MILISDKSQLRPECYWCINWEWIYPGENWVCGLVKWDEDWDLVRKVDQLFPCYYIAEMQKKLSNIIWILLNFFSHIISPILHPTVDKS
jgi:hypothetical protein